MRYITECFLCKKDNLFNQEEIKELFECIRSLEYSSDSYKKIFEGLFKENKWNPREIIDSTEKNQSELLKNKIFIKLEEGTRAKLYRDCCKFQQGFFENLFKQVVYVVPCPNRCTPETEAVISGTDIDYNFTHSYLSRMLMPVPILLVGLCPD